MAKGIFDTHTHLNDAWYESEGITSEEIIKRANLAGVSYFCNIGYDIKSSKKAVRQALEHRQVYAAVGIHPNEAHKVHINDLEQIDILANGDKVVAIGEVGLDYYHDGKKYKNEQVKILEAQIDIAMKYDLPVSFHIRDENGKQDAYHDVIEIIDRKKLKSGIVHCYTQDPKLAGDFTKRGFYISIPGIVTFSSAKSLHQSVKEISLNWLLLETDAPYLAPEPMRGTINSSEYIAYTAERVAKLKNVSVQDVISATSENAKRVFKIK